MRLSGTIFVVSCALLGAACARSGRPDLSPTTAGASASTTPPPTPTLRLPSTPFHPASATDTLVGQCAPMVDGLPADAKGRLAIRGEGGLVLVDVRTGMTAATLESLGGFTHVLGRFPLVSPGGRFLAFVEGPIASGGGQATYLRIVDASGTEVSRTPFAQPWDLLTGWLGTDRVEVAVNSDPKGTMLAYNPFLESTFLLPPSFNDILSAPPGAEWYLQAPVALYDPSLSRVAYYAYDETGYSYVLWDAKEARQLWRSQEIGFSFDPPAWSPDGTYVAFNLVTEVDGLLLGRLVLVSRDGQVEAEVDISSLARSGAASIAPDWPTWSPRGDQLAFWISRFGPGTQEPTTLGIIDLATMRVHDFCIEGAGDAIPVWSPDGRFIASYGVIVDTVEAKAYRLEGMSPVGWLAPAD